jgi:hypothetical protein
VHALTAPFLAAAGLLALAGAQKVMRPQATGAALRTQGLPSGHAVVRLIGVVELGIAAAALLGLPGGAALLAAAYASFAAFVVLALVRDRPLTSCGCFADPDVPATTAHVAVTAAMALCGSAVAFGTPADLPTLLSGSAGAALGTLLGGVLVGWLSYLLLSELPRVSALAARRPDTPTSPQVFTIASRSSTP